MSLGKPKLTLKNFSGMGDNGLYWLEGMKPIKINGQSILTAGWGTQYYLSEDTSGMTGLQQFYDMARLDISSTDAGHIVVNSNNKLFSFHNSTTGNNKGLLHTNTLSANSYPGILTTAKNNILYPSASKLGVAFFCEIKTATSTSLTGQTYTNGVASDVNFGTLGITSSSGSNKIYNLTKKEEYTNTTASPTTTLNFTAPSTTPQAGDLILVFVDAKYDFGTAESVANHFVSQTLPGSWKRQAFYFNDTYYILNGNYLSSLNSAETTFQATAKQLPLNCQAVSAGVNQDQVLIGSDFYGRGKLLLWNGADTNWTNIVECDNPPTAITAYKQGWLVIIGASLYYTNGYSLEYLSAIPDSTSRSTASTHFGALKVYDDKVLIGSANYSYTREKAGIYIYDFKNGWIYSSIENTDGKQSHWSNVTAIFNSTVNGIEKIFASTASQWGTHRYPVVNLYDDNTTSRHSAMFYVKLPAKMQLGLVELNLSPRLSKRGVDAADDVTVNVNYSTLSREFYQQIQPGAGSTTSSIANGNGANCNSVIGQMILIPDGDYAGERSFITAIAGGGTSNEVLAISPALSGVDTSNNYVKVDLYTAGSATVNTNDINQELNFNIPSFYGDKLILEVQFDCTGGAPMLDLHSINLY